MAGKGTLTVRVLGDTKPFEKAVGGIGGKLGKLATVGAAAFGAAAAAAVTGAFKVADFGDEVAKSAQKAGVAVEPFQELRFAFGQGGVEAATMDTALLKFNKRLGESATGTGTASEAFETLGVKLTDASGGVRDTTETLDEVLPKLAAIESDAERAALAGDLFGQRAGPELAAALSDGIGGIDEAREKAQELGIVMGGDAASAAEKFTDQFDDIKQSAMGLVRDALIPVMVVLSDRVFPAIQDGIGKMRELYEVFKDGDGVIGGLQDVFANLFSGEGGGLFSGILEAARNAFAALVEWLSGDGINQILTFMMEARERLFNTALVLFPAILDAAIQFLPELINWITGTMIPQLLDFIVSAVPMLLDAGVELFTSLVDAIVTVLPDLVSTLLGDVLPTVLDSILGMIPELLETATELFLMLVDAVIEVLPELVGVLLGEVLPNVLTTVLGMLPELLDAAVTTFLALVDAVLEVLPELIAILIGTVLPAIIVALLGMIPELLEAAVQVFTALVLAIPEVLPELVGSIFTDIIPAIISAITTLGPQLFDSGKEIIRQLARGIGSMGSAVGSAMGDIGGKIRGFLPFSPAKEGPLSGSGSPELAGAKIGSMVAGGLDASVSNIRRAAHRAAGAAQIDVAGGDGAFMPSSFSAGRSVSVGGGMSDAEAQMLARHFARELVLQMRAA